LLIIHFLFGTCKNAPDDLEIALNLAGNNRNELEKVLQHYQQHPADSLKYKAAVFLIENMPYYYSYRNKTLEHYQKELYPTAIKRDCTGEDAVKMLERKYGKLNPREFEKLYDVEIITADYLIRNIEQAFKVWREQAWGKQITFDDFCEQILPYRIKNEPLDDWRETYYNTFQPVLDSLLTNKHDPLEAVQVLWDSLNSKQWVYLDKKPNGYPYPSALNLLNNHRFGDCHECASLAVYAMRALGIPGGIDGFLQFPYGQSFHLWNYVPDTLGNIWEFSMYAYPPRPAKREKPIMGRVFRKCFGVQEESLPVITKKEKDLPPLLKSAFQKDVSEYYLHDASIRVPVEAEALKDTILYLCTFSSAGWVPVAWTAWNAKEKAFVFDFVEKNMLYLPAYYLDRQIHAAACAGSVNDEGIYVPLLSDISRKQTLRVERKYPLKPGWFKYRKRIIGGKFQVADNPDFRNAVTLHTIKKETDMHWYDIDLPASKAWRYIRFLSGEKGHCNMAEIVFFDKNGEKLSGKIIGTKGSFQNKNDNRKEAVFDDDPFTYYDAIEGAGAWAGLELEKSEYIKKIQYIFRNDDNLIRVGDTYELFYWNNTYWESMDKKVANSSLLEYKECPIKALFWLHNYTRGQEELPFFYENGEQIFWEK
jgi:hypothetical protein